MKKLVFVVFIFPIFVFSQGPVDGFFKGKGNLDAALSGTQQNSTKFYSGLGLINYPRSLTVVSLFGEYGLTKNIDIIASVPFINGQFQDAGIYTKARLSKPFKFGTLSLIPALGVSFPMSNYETQTGQSIGQRATQIQPKLVFQIDFSKGFFVQAQSGYNYNLQPVPSSIPVSGKIGFSYKKIYSDIWFDYQKGLGDVIWIGGISQDFRTLHVTYSRIGGVFYYSLKPKFGCFVNGSFILNGVNIGKAYTVGAGFVYKFQLLNKKTETVTD